MVTELKRAPERHQWRTAEFGKYDFSFSVGQSLVWKNEEPKILCTICRSLQCCRRFSICSSFVEMVSFEPSR